VAWDKHGIRQAGFFTTVVCERQQSMTYFVAWEALALARSDGRLFTTAPAWLKVRRRVQRESGPIRP